MSIARAPAPLLHKLIERYPECSLILVGCQTSSYAFPCCEYDFIAVGDSCDGILGGSLAGFDVDVHPIDSRELDLRKDPHLALTLARSSKIRDYGLVLSSAGDLLKREGIDWFTGEYCKIEATSSLMKVSRVLESLSEGEISTANLWLLASGYDLCNCVLALSDQIAHPTHLAPQMKEHGINVKKHDFSAWASILELNAASKVSVPRRLESIDCIADAFRKAEGNGHTGMWTKVYSNLRRRVEAKAKYMLSRQLEVGAFTYLGYMGVKMLEELYHSYCNARKVSPLYARAVKELIADRDFALRPEILRLMGLSGDANSVDKRASMIKTLVKELLSNAR